MHPVTQVNTKNVKRLVPKWSFSFGVLDAQNTTPLIHDGVMYVTSSHGRTFAVDAKTGSMIWQYHHQLPEDVGKTMCCDIGNRGAALYGDKVFVATPDAHVVALDMKTGKPVWDVTLSDYKNSYTMTVAPLVVKGKVIVGLSGSGIPDPVFIEALDASTGKQVWRRYTIPSPGSRDPRPGIPIRTISSTGVRRPGSRVHTIRRSTRSLGYRQPEPRLGRRRRQGDNLYSNSTLALNPDSGAIKFHFQYTPFDVGISTVRTSTSSPISAGARSGCMVIAMASSTASIAPTASSSTARKSPR